MLLFARTLIGLAIGADSAIATAYIAEYAPSNRRGALSMLQQWMITVGILVSYVVALIILKIAPGSAGSTDWRLILGLGAIPALIGLALRTKMPESPRWLMRHGDYEGVQKALGSSAPRSRCRTWSTPPGSWRRPTGARSGAASWTPGVRRALIVVCVFFIFQQITGINVPLYYGPHLLGPLFQGSSSLVDKTISGVEVTADAHRGQRGRHLLRVPLDRPEGPPQAGHRRLHRDGPVRPVGRGRAVLLHRHLADRRGDDRPGRVHRLVRHRGGRHRLAAAGRGVPHRVRGRAASTGATVDWLANFALIEVFPLWQSGIGLGWVLACFAGLCVVAIGFVYRFVPETKSHSVEEITEIFEHEAQTGETAAVTT